MRHSEVAAAVGALVQQQGGGRAPAGAWAAEAEAAGGTSSEARAHSARAGHEREKKRKAAAATGVEAPADAALCQGAAIRFSNGEERALREAGAELAARDAEMAARDAEPAARGKRAPFNLRRVISLLDNACGADWCASNVHGGRPSSTAERGSGSRKLYHAIYDKVKSYRTGAGKQP